MRPLATCGGRRWAGQGGSGGGGSGAAAAWRAGLGEPERARKEWTRGGLWWQLLEWVDGQTTRGSVWLFACSAHADSGRLWSLTCNTACLRLPASQGDAEDRRKLRKKAEEDAKRKAREEKQEQVLEEAASMAKLVGWHAAG